MQREIKFRAWYESGEEKQMLFVGDKFGTTHNLDCCKYAVEGQPVKLMQYTGLKDKNGVEIYEGDIVKRTATNPYWDNNLIQIDSVIYERCEFKTKTFELNLQSLGNKYLNIYEVIGNIYENPELRG